MLLVALIFNIIPLKLNADTSQVNVIMPSFKVTLNGEEIDNEYNKYPLLVYKDITYFPMTYDGARFLGLKANWYDKPKYYQAYNGVLFIGVCPENEKQSTLKIIKNDSKNAKYYTATIADYGLALNTTTASQFIKNTAEEYPILNFRGISYFPLTWKNAVDRFAWHYTWSLEDGLKINSSNKKLDEETIKNEVLSLDYD